MKKLMMLFLTILSVGLNSTSYAAAAKESNKKEQADYFIVRFEGPTMATVINGWGGSMIGSPLKYMAGGKAYDIVENKDLKLNHDFIVPNKSNIVKEIFYETYQSPVWGEVDSGVIVFFPVKNGNKYILRYKKDATDSQNNVATRLHFAKGDETESPIVVQEIPLKEFALAKVLPSAAADVAHTPGTLPYELQKAGLLPVLKAKNVTIDQIRKNPNMALDANGNTILMIAAGRQAADLINFLLERLHAKVNIKNNQGFTAYHFAKAKNNADLMKRLYVAG